MLGGVELAVSHRAGAVVGGDGGGLRRVGRRGHVPECVGAAERGRALAPPGDVALGRLPARRLGLAACGVCAGGGRVQGLRQQDVLGREGAGPVAVVGVVADGVAVPGGRRRRRRRRRQGHHRRGVAAGEHRVGEAAERGQQAEAEEGRGEGNAAHLGRGGCLISSQRGSVSLFHILVNVLPIFASDSSPKPLAFPAQPLMLAYASPF